MLFNSYQFLLFFPIVTILYYLLPHKYRWFHLLFASCFFYMFFIPVYILILFFTIVIDYIAGIMLENAEGRRKYIYLVMSIVANVGILAFFKYYNFFVENVNDILRLTHSNAQIEFLKIALPIGLSFHTFQAMSYTIEVYRGNQKAERHFGIYALYVMFYPQLVAGPIERPQELLHQFHEEHKFNYDNVVCGLRQMMWGLFKKVVIADFLATQIVDPIFMNPNGDKYTGIALLLGLFCFSFQLYCDFSGYSDIARGAARVMGYQLMINFDRPFSSKSISELWRRWHISLSSWFNDYVYNPTVGGLRNWGKTAVIFGLIFTFVLCGFWHGAAWKYVLFGLMQGVAIAYEFLTRKRRRKIFGVLPQWLNNGLSRIITFVYFSISLIFFRCINMKESLAYFKGIAGVGKDLAKGKIFNNVHGGVITGRYFHIHNTDLFYAAFLLVLLEMLQMVHQKESMNTIIQRQNWMVRWSLYTGLFFVFFLLGVYNNRQFIYFQF